MTQQWKPMPPVLTEKMHGAAVRTIINCTGNDDWPPAVYAAFLKHAPTPPASAQDDAKDDILWWIMREAQAAKEPCGDDPESAAAIRNAKLAAIGGAAAQALGLVRGPSYPAPAAGDARLPALNIEAAAKAMADCMDYPWAHMPEQGRATMREHAQTVIRAASQQQEG